MNRKEGIVKKVKPEGGFGFIETNFGPDIFFHASTLGKDRFDSLIIGQMLEFDIETTYKGLVAKNITFLSEAPNLHLYKKEHGLFESSHEKTRDQVVFVQLPIASQWYRTREEAEADARQFALKLRANALLNKKWQKEKRKSDHNNYIYNVHKITADACLVAKKDLQGTLSQVDLEAQAEAMRDTLERFKSEYKIKTGRSIYDSIEMTSEKVSKPGAVIFGIIFFFLFIIMMLSN